MQERESEETLKMFHNVVVSDLLRELIGYEPKKKVGSYMVGTVITITRLND